MTLGLTAFVLGSRYEWVEFIQLANAALIFVVLGLITIALPHRTETVVHLRPTRVSVGQLAEAQIELRVGSLPLMSPLFRLPLGDEQITFRLPSVTASGPAQHTVALPTSRRGVIDVGPLHHVRGDLLGLLRVERTVSPVHTLHVRPVVVAIPSLAAGIVHDLEGVASNQFAASDLSFHALREYVPGDDPRHVHWKSTAKAGAMLVRQFQLTRRSHATVLLDAQSDSYASGAEFELAVSTASSVALRAVMDDYEVTFACGDLAITSRDSQALLDLACRFERGSAGLHEVGIKVAAAVGATSLVVLVTGSRVDERIIRQGAAHFPPSADRITARADVAGEPKALRQDMMSSVVLSALSQLPALLVRAAP